MNTKCEFGSLGCGKTETGLLLAKLAHVQEIDSGLLALLDADTYENSSMAGNEDGMKRENASLFHVIPKVVIRDRLCKEICKSLESI